MWRNGFSNIRESLEGAKKGVASGVSDGVEEAVDEAVEWVFGGLGLWELVGWGGRGLQILRSC